MGVVRARTLTRAAAGGLILLLLPYGSADAVEHPPFVPAAGGAEAPSVEPPAVAPDEPSWRVTTYGAVMVHSAMRRVPFRLSHTDPAYKLMAVAVARRVGSWGRVLDFEVEGQLARHIEGSDHFELNGLGVIRWMPFPWDRLLDTSFAFGPGLSVASEVPGYEKRREMTSVLLAYILWEIEVALPRIPDWRLVGRLHHRSGAYGTFNGVYAGSNAVGLGLKYAF